MEKRRIDIKITSNSKKVMNDLGNSTEKAGKKSVGVLGKLKALANGIGSGFSAATGGIRAFSAALVSTGVGAIVVALGSMVALLGKSINTSREFEASLSTLKAITGATNEEIAALSGNARELGRTTAFTASQVVELQTEFSKLGFTTGEILKATEATLDLAAASGTDLAEAASVAGSTIRGFGLDTSETQRVVDVMAKSFTSSALDMEKFRESMKLVAPIAKTVKVPIEQASAALAVLADRGVSGSMAGTQLRRIMSELATKTGKDFATSLEITAERLNGATSTADKLAIATELVGDRAKGSLIALAENRDALGDLEIAFDNAGGAAERMAEEKLNNLNGDITKLSSAWEGFLLGIEDGGGVLNKISRGAIQLLTKSISFVTKASVAMSDNFVVGFTSMKRIASTSASRLGETFKNLGLNIKRFASQALVDISEIPIIGKLIDKESAEASLMNVELALEESNARLAMLANKAGNESTLRAEHFARLRAEREIKVAKETKATVDKIEEGFEEGESGGDDGAQKAIDKRLDFLNKLKAAEDNFNAKTALEKNELERKRHLDRLAQLEMDENEKNELRNRIDEFYNKKKQAIEAENKLKKNAEDEAQLQKELERIQTLNQQKTQLAMEAFDNAAMIAGQESTLGKALFLAKQALIVREMIMNAKKTIVEAKETAKRVAMKGAEASADIAAGSAKAGATLNPFIIATYAATAIGIAATIASAIKKSKSLTSQFGGGNVSGGAPINTNVRTQTTQSNREPSFNVLGRTDTGVQALQNTINNQNQRPIKTYVVASELTNAQQLEDRSKDNSSL